MPNIPFRPNSKAISRPLTTTITTTATRLPLYRPLAADIPGDRTERLYFHKFRQFGETALGIRHVHTGRFWTEVVPQYCHEVEAVRHAYIAVGAAYVHFHVAGNSADKTSAPSDIEQFILKQYSLAMKSIPDSNAGLPVKRQYGIVMMCCAAFFCVEILRGEFDSAFAHLSNGLRLMADLPAEVADILHNPAKWSQGMDTSYLRVAYMIQLLTRWELTAGYLSPGFQPRLTIQEYRKRELDQAVQGVAKSVEELQDIVDCFCQDANAFAWQTKAYTHNSDPAIDPNHKLQYWALQRRSENIAEMLNLHRDLHHGCHTETREHVAYRSCLLNQRVAAWTLESSVFASEIMTNEPQRIAELVEIAESVRDAHKEEADGVGGSSFGVDVGVVPMLYIARRHCQEDKTREKLSELIREWPRKESLWDGPALRKLVM